MQATLPAVHVLHLLELMRRWEVPAERLLEGLGLSEQGLAEPQARVDLRIAEQVVERARSLSGEPGLGFHLGLQMRISAHGELGVAAMTASTVREALEVAVRYTPLRTAAIGLRLHEHDELAAVVIDEHVPLGSIRDVVVFTLVVGIWQMGNALTGRELHGDAELAFDEPSYFHRFADFAPGRTRFSRPANQLVFPRSNLDLPLVMADPASQRVAKEQCERALDVIGREADLVMRVRAVLARDEGGYRSLPETAKRLHLSERTLKRRLAEQGLSFSEIVDRHRQERAMLLLRSRDLSIDEIAQRLGYSDAANFSRAFRRWTGTSPRAYRKSQPT